MKNYQEILLELGYRLTDNGDCWRTNALYRGGDNATALAIYKKDGKWHDFVEGRGGDFEELVKLTDDKYSIEGIAEPLKIKKSEIKQDRTYPKSMLVKLVPHYNFLQKRNIKDETSKAFDIGLAHSGQLNRRLVVPIFDEKYDHIIGFTGRFYDEKVPDGIVKYKHIGRKTNWLWPAHKSKPFILESGEVYLVESPMCVLALWQCGIKNTMCLFGLSASSKLISFLVGCNPNKIYICTNNEDSERGNDAALKIKKKLDKFFNSDKIVIKLPELKDFSDMLKEDKTGKSILEWSKK